MKGLFPNYKCRMYTGEIRPLVGLPEEYIVVSNESLEEVNKFCCLGDMIVQLVVLKNALWLESDAAGRTFACIYLQSVVFQAFVRSVVLYGSETGAVKEKDLANLERNEMMMVW